VPSSLEAFVLLGFSARLELATPRGLLHAGGTAGDGCVTALLILLQALAQLRVPLAARLLVAAGDVLLAHFLIVDIGASGLSHICLGAEAGSINKHLLENALEAFFAFAHGPSRRAVAASAGLALLPRDGQVDLARAAATVGAADHGSLAAIIAGAALFAVSEAFRLDAVFVVLTLGLRHADLSASVAAAHFVIAAGIIIKAFVDADADHAFTDFRAHALLIIFAAARLEAHAVAGLALFGVESRAALKHELRSFNLLGKVFEVFAEFEVPPLSFKIAGQDGVENFHINGALLVLAVYKHRARSNKS